MSTVLSPHLQLLIDALEPDSRPRDLAHQLLAALNDPARARSLWSQLSTTLNELSWIPPDNVRAAVTAIDDSLGDRPDLRAMIAPLSERASGSAAAELEQQEQIQFAAILHALVLRSNQVLPPGKGILSLLARPRSADQYADNPIAARVADTVTRAFFDSIAETFSTSDTVAHVARLNQLYHDLHAAFTDVLPPQIPEMATLAAPIASSHPPLETARDDLKALLNACRRRCAPARDATIDGLLRTLADVTNSLAQAVTNTIRGTLKLAEDMRHDMLAFASSKWREADVKLWLRAEAIVHEKAAILSLTDPESARKVWDQWLSTQPERDSTLEHWVSRLLIAVGQNTPVQIQLKPDLAENMPPEKHVLPPQFALCIGDLVRIQNLVQALVVVAALLALIPNRQETTEASSASHGDRLWSLLSSEIDPGSTPSPEQHTTLADLEAELLRVNPQADRNAINRILRYEDPVFALLQKRVLAALEASVPSAVQRYRARRGAAPLRLITGRGRGTRQDDPAASDNIPVDVPVVKGLEDEVLRRRLASTAEDVSRIVLWITDVWGAQVLNGS
ncbi:hypothetical protein BKA62DRAFT_824477 [Auriculariales sp. MPI-PUGE-AT-0066]|nr:hypothetical protein BKA62DRAFT_824477 [Auriculariales sp. MPI-PUGE-AT-0066]